MDMQIPARFAQLFERTMLLADRCLARAWVSYVLVGALQIKILWNIWRYRDLTTGDTSSYFLSAWRWSQDLSNNILWSPLYTTFYGIMLQILNDVYAATTFHRVVIVLCATLGVLALARRILPPAYALLIAVWWASLPIVYDTLYEVHLFAVLPIIGILMLATLPSTPLVRGCILAALVATTVLVRNEYVVALVLLAAAALVYEIWFASSGEPGRARRLALGYGAPIAGAVLVGVAFYAQSYLKFPAIVPSSNAKHTVNMCQVYAFGYSQRHDWTLSPWVECYGLMQQTFGMRLPTLGQMLMLNPRATLEHFAWNISLIPNGLQVALFNRMSGSVNPDYAPVLGNSRLALILSLLLLGTVVSGSVVVVRHWSRWSGHVRQHLQLMLVMATMLIVAVAVMVTQRPRPSYFFAATLILMIAAMGAAAILARRRTVVVNRAAVFVAIFVLVAIPPYYERYPSPRPLYQNLVRLQPFGEQLRTANGRVLIGDYEGELANYLRVSRRGATLNYQALDGWQRDTPLADFLASRSIAMFFVQPRILSELRSVPTARPLLEDPASVGWTRLAPAAGDDWMLLARTAPR